MVLTSASTLPADGRAGALAGRVWRPELDGPSVVAIRAEGVFDISREFPTMLELCEAADPAQALRGAQGERIGDLEPILANTPPDRRDTTRPWLLAPVDLQVVKAAGVTFVISLLERVIEERARSGRRHPQRGGAPGRPRPRAAQARLATGCSAKGSPRGARRLESIPGSRHRPRRGDLHQGTRPLRGGHRLRCRHPQRLDVEQPRARGRPRCRFQRHDRRRDARQRRQPARLRGALGAASSAGQGQQRLLRHRPVPAPPRRELQHLRRAADHRHPHGRGHRRFRLEGSSSISRISRDPDSLAAQLVGPHHQYPDGAVLFLGTMFAPIQDRDAPGKGFTHKVGDIVTIAAPKLGSLVNRIRHSQDCERWSHGVAALMRNLAKRRLL